MIRAQRAIFTFLLLAAFLAEKHVLNTVDVQAIEEEHRQRKLAAHRIVVDLAAESTHGELEWLRRAIGPQRDGFAVENKRA